MPTLFLSAPNSKTQQGVHQKDFYAILNSKVCPDYGISANLMRQTFPGMKVVLFDRERRLQAEGKATRFAVTSKAGNGVQRSDVTVPDLTKVTYSNPPRVNRFGVAIED